MQAEPGGSFLVHTLKWRRVIPKGDRVESPLHRLIGLLPRPSRPLFSVSVVARLSCPACLSVSTPWFSLVVPLVFGPEFYLCFSFWFLFLLLERE